MTDLLTRAWTDFSLLVFSEDIVKAMINPNHKPTPTAGNYGSLPPMQQNRSYQPHVQQNLMPSVSQNSYGSLPQLLPVSVSVPAHTPELETAKVPETEAPKAYSGPSVHTFGFGSDHDANMLKYGS